jgi:hypothetical protein
VNWLPHTWLTLSILEFPPHNWPTLCKIQVKKNLICGHFRSIRDVYIFSHLAYPPDFTWWKKIHPHNWPTLCKIQVKKSFICGRFRSFPGVYIFSHLTYPLDFTWWKKKPALTTDLPFAKSEGNFLDGSGVFRPFPDLSIFFTTDLPFVFYRGWLQGVGPINIPWKSGSFLDGYGAFRPF